MSGLWIILVVFLIVGQQKTNGDNPGRHDVYIAGFFPFGKGVENSRTGNSKPIFPYFVHIHALANQ